MSSMMNSVENARKFGAYRPRHELLIDEFATHSHELRVAAHRHLEVRVEVLNATTIGMEIGGGAHRGLLRSFRAAKKPA
jgi:hypothetical protein